MSSISPPFSLPRMLPASAPKNTRPCPLKCISSGRWMLYTSTISLELVFGERPTPIGPSGASGAQTLAQAFPYAADRVLGQVRQAIRAVYKRIGKCVSSEAIRQQNASARNIYGLLCRMVEHTPHQCRHGFALMIQVNGADQRPDRLIRDRPPTSTALTVAAKSAMIASSSSPEYNSANSSKRFSPALTARCSS